MSISNINEARHQANTNKTIQERIDSCSTTQEREALGQAFRIEGNRMKEAGQLVRDHMTGKLDALPEWTAQEYTNYRLDNITTEDWYVPLLNWFRENAPELTTDTQHQAIIHRELKDAMQEHGWKATLRAPS